jgi:hypothetical protein
MKTRQNATEQQVKEMHQRIRNAFVELRTKYGFFARMNFWCCQSCAWADIDDAKTNVVFFHNQDNDNLNENATCYLAHRGDAALAVKILKKHNISVEWDGSEDSRILIKHPDIK